MSGEFLSPHGPGVRVVHWARIGIEAAVAVGAATALLWAPAGQPLPGAPAPADAATPPPPPFDLGPARLAVAAETAALAAALVPLQTGHAHVAASVRPGDTLARVLTRADAAPPDADAAVAALSGVFDLRSLAAGQDIDLYLGRSEGAASLLGFTFSPDVEETIQVARLSDGSYRARRFDVPLSRRIARAEGAVSVSLYADAQKAGADAPVVGAITQLLAHTVDFQREIHDGDAFEILFEQYLDPRGEVAKTGDILYLGFNAGARRLEYWRFTPPGEKEAGFYDAAGESVQRFLMKTPINGARLSSGFGSRKHPILGYTRMHKGTDFAAPKGTPIYAAGAGVVERANVYGTFGNYIRIRHSGGYKTVYAHLNGFAKGVRAGARVTQGQVIGYVGTTGNSTGPHLHYEVHLNGDAINPSSLDAPTGRVLADDEKAAFAVERARIDALRERATPATSRPGREMIAGTGEADHAALEKAGATEG